MPPRRALVLAGAVLTLAAVLLLGAAPASAHPLGNFTVNTHVGLRIEPEAVAVRVVVDSAEIPTVQAFPSGVPPEAGPVARAYRQTRCEAAVGELALTVDSAPVRLEVTSSALEFPPGEAGLATTRLTCDARAPEPLATVGSTLELEGAPGGGRPGWHEVVATGDGVRLADSDVPAQSISDVLREYPADLLQSPLDESGARVTVAAGSGVAAGGETDAGRRDTSAPFDRLTDRFTGLVTSPELSVGVALLAVVGALVLGAAHAFAPGHGKSLMAAYLVGREGSFRQAALIGLSVTATHTTGVLVLGVVLSSVVLTAPERVYPWLGLLGGVLVTGIGVTLVRRALPRRAAGLGSDHGSDHGSGHAHEHAHAHVSTALVAGSDAHGHGDGHGHAHGHDHGHDHGHSHGSGKPHSHRVATDVRGLLAVGFAGGLVPSPSAVLVLLGGIALGRAWFGVLLVLAYGVGMALALALTGLALAHAHQRVRRWARDSAAAGSRRAAALGLTRWLPLATAAAVVVIGIGLALRALAQL